MLLEVRELHSVKYVVAKNTGTCCAIVRVQVVSMKAFGTASIADELRRFVRVIVPFPFRPVIVVETCTTSCTLGLPSTVFTC